MDRCLITKFQAHELLKNVFDIAIDIIKPDALQTTANSTGLAPDEMYEITLNISFYR
jgi:hypothetical protein